MHTSRRFLLLTALSICGCSQPFLEPMDWEPIQITAPLKTQGGLLLECEPNGTLIARPGPEDIEVALGASLQETEQGLEVTNRLTATTPLQVGDIIQHAHPVAHRAKDPGSVHDEFVREMLGVNETPRASSSGTIDAPPIRPTTDSTPIDPGSAEPPSVVERVGHPVKVLRDLQGYALSWCFLDLVVQRAGKTISLRTEVGRPQVVAGRAFPRSLTRKLGFDALEVESLPADLQPVQATEEGDLLVTFVAQRSPLALLGLRPLDVIRGPVELSGELITLELIDAQGGQRVIELEPSENTQADLLYGLIDVETDASRTKVSLGLGYVLRYQNVQTYNPRTDQFEENTGWSLPFLSWTTYGGAGRGDRTAVGVPW